MPETSSQGFPAVALDVTRETVLGRCSYYSKVRLWPTPLGGVDPRGWLENFTSGEERHALYLLNAFLFFSNEVIDRIFLAACHSLSHRSVLRPDPGESLREAWNSFLRGVLVTPVTGERPAPTDSGSLFTRRARHRLGIEKDRIKEQSEAIAHVYTEGGNVLFVDDFVGTGNQFIETFERQYYVDGKVISFASMEANGVGRYYYCPIVATADGAARIRKSYPNVVLSPGHVLSPRYSVLHPDSLVWPDDLRDTAQDFVHGASMRAGIPDDPSEADHWEGFGQQGLALAFEHGAPDATIPLFWWAENNWTPLRQRG